MNFIDYYRLSDAAVAENFEGCDRRANFTEYDWYLIRNAQKITAWKSLDTFGSKLYNTKQFRKPIALLETKIEQLINGTETRDTLRYLIESAHDTQLLFTLRWLEPAMYDFEDMPFASSIMYELHYDDQCLKDEKSAPRNCFTL